ncbi:MAG TPA: 1,2-phenylacetyl-CoA epoxidase subunit PaaC [Nocardioidaceae bacterium]|nr:1,2-phenylacetyl-CoA epoxidase subunit PaaC [Nocardioidaceae bacterium]
MSDPAGQSANGGATTAHVRYVLALADDALIASQRMGEWIASAPELEEDVALANIGLDLLGQARSLLAHAGRLEGAGRGEDDLAYFRDERDFLNVQLVERENGDFAVTMARLLLLSTYLHELWSALRTSSDETLAAIAAKAVKEVDYHVDHARMWVLRLGDGTEESHARMQAGLEAEWPYSEELFDDSHVDPALVEAGAAIDPATLRDAWQRRVAAVVSEATLALPDVRPAVTGGRRGVHTEQMGYLLAEMQYLARSHPGASW